MAAYTAAGGRVPRARRRTRRPSPRARPRPRPDGRTRGDQWGEPGGPVELLGEVPAQVVAGFAWGPRTEVEELAHSACEAVGIRSVRDGASLRVLGTHLVAQHGAPSGAAVDRPPGSPGRGSSTGDFLRCPVFRSRGGPGRSSGALGTSVAPAAALPFGLEVGPAAAPAPWGISAAPAAAPRPLQRFVKIPDGWQLSSIFSVLTLPWALISCTVASFAISYFIFRDT